MRRKRRSRAIACSAALAMLAAGGCGGGSNRAASVDADGGVTRTAEDGAVTLSVVARPARVPFDRRAELVVEARVADRTNVELADYSASLEGGEHQYEFRLHPRERRIGEPTKEGGRVWRQRYEIEFFLPGEYELPPARVTWVDGSGESMGAADIRGDEGGGEPRRKELTTEAIRIVALETDQAKLSPEELANIPVLPPVELREPWGRRWVITAAVLIVAGIVAALLVRRARTEQVEPVEVIAADEWARRQFAALAADDLIGRGLVQEFYYRISAIVRGYIERRYGVSAPEMTTEEFLSAAARDRRFDESATRELRGFLSACDLVKYARHRPAAGEWDELLRTARDFVERTREVAEIVESGGGSATSVAEVVGA